MKSKITKIVMLSAALSSLMLVKMPVGHADDDGYNQDRQDRQDDRGDRLSDDREDRGEYAGGVDEIFRNAGDDLHKLTADADRDGHKFIARVENGHDGYPHFWDKDGKEITGIEARRNGDNYEYYRGKDRVYVDDYGYNYRYHRGWYDRDERYGDWDDTEHRITDKFVGIHGLELVVDKKVVREDWHHPESWDDARHPHLDKRQRACVMREVERVKSSLSMEILHDYMKELTKNHRDGEVKTKKPRIIIEFFQQLGERDPHLDHFKFSPHRKQGTSDFILPVVLEKNGECMGSRTGTLDNVFMGERLAYALKIPRLSGDRNGELQTLRKEAKPDRSVGGDDDQKDSDANHAE